MTDLTLDQRSGLRWRHEPSRLEGFSDAVFGFALTLLVVSLETPRTYDDLMELMRGVPAFAVCFLLLMMIWNFHRHFFSLYPLNDALTVVLNGTLLFVILLYVYPLRFVFQTLLTTGIRGTVPGENGQLQPIVTSTEVPTLMALYGLGFVAIFSLFTLLYWNVGRQNEALGLNPAETLEAKLHRNGHLINVSIGLASVVLALSGSIAAVFAGWIYFLLGPAHLFYSRYCARVRTRI